MSNLNKGYDISKIEEVDINLLQNIERGLTEFLFPRFFWDSFEKQFDHDYTIEHPCFDVYREDVLKVREELSRREKSERYKFKLETII